MIEYAAIVTAVEKALKVVSQFVKVATEAVKKGEDARLELKKASEQERLFILLRRIQEERYGQARLPWLFRLAHGDRSLQHWDQLRRCIARLQDSVAEILELLEAERGQFVVERRDAFEALLFGMKDRKRIFEAMMSLPPPATEQDFKYLVKIAEFYEALIDEIRSADRSLADYLVGGKKKAKFPDRPGHALEDIGILSDWSGKRLLDDKEGLQ